MAVSRIEQTLSEFTSTEYSGGYPQKGGSRQAWKLQSQIWMNLCKFTKLKKEQLFSDDELFMFNP